MHRYLLSLSLLSLAAAGCSSSSDAQQQPAPDAATSPPILLYVGTFNLGLSDITGSVLDGAYGDGKLALLVGAHLVVFDAATRNRTEKLALTGNTCPLRSVAFAVDKWIALAVCEDSSQTIYSVSPTGALVTISSFSAAKALYLAFDDSTARYWLYGAGHYSALASTTPLSWEFVEAAVPNWGPTSGFDCSQGRLYYARNAFEGPMHNRIALSKTADTSKITDEDVENATGLTGVSGMMVIAHDTTVWALTATGTIVEFSLQVDQLP